MVLRGRSARAYLTEGLLGIGWLGQHSRLQPQEQAEHDQLGSVFAVEETPTWL